MKGLTGCKNFECKYLLACEKCFSCKDFSNPYSCTKFIHTCSACSHWCVECFPNMFENVENKKQAAE